MNIISFIFGEKSQNIIHKSKINDETTTGRSGGKCQQGVKGGEGTFFYWKEKS